MGPSGRLDLFPEVFTYLIFKNGVYFNWIMNQHVSGQDKPLMAEGDEIRSTIPASLQNPEPLFILFANFQFNDESLEDFFTMLSRADVEIPLEEIFLYFRPEDKEYINGPDSLTRVDKEKILKDLQSDQGEFRSLLSRLVVKDKEDKEDKLHFFFDKGNLYCSEIPVQFTYHKKRPGKLDLAAPSINSIGEVGWANFILGLVAVDLGKYLMDSPVTKIRLCKKKDCRKFFTRRAGNAIFCSDYCKNEFHHNEKRDSGYFRGFMKERRIKGVYQPKKKRTVKTILK